MVAPHSPLEQFRDAVMAPPVWSEGGSWRFVLGTDGLGRDMLSRLMYGARISLFIGLTVMVVSLGLGVVLGLASAFFGALVDVAITRVMDLIMAVPDLVLAILAVAILGPSLTNTIVAVTIVYLPRYVRLVRGSALGERDKDYVTAAKVVGVGPIRLMFATVLPNCLAPLVVQAALGVSDAILEAAALGFLGLGAQPPTPEWGAMLADFARIHPLQPVDRHLPGSGDPDHGRGHQPDGRRPPGRARSRRCGEADGSFSRSATCRSPSPRVAAGSAPSTVSTSWSTRTTSSPSSANPAPASRSPCWPSWGCCLGRPPSRRIA